MKIEWTIWGLAIVVSLAACQPRSNPDRLALEDTSVIHTWQCRTGNPEIPGQFVSTAPKKGRLAERLLQCPFNDELQIEAMLAKAPNDATPAEMSELVTKIRWGLDYEYALYEKTIQHHAKPGRIIPRFIAKILPGSRFLNSLIPDLTDSHVVVGPARDLVVRQMRADRAATGDAIDERLAAANAHKVTYPIWQALVDLDAYAKAGSVESAIESLDLTLASRSRAYGVVTRATH